jgi:hypothetical protein
VHPDILDFAGIAGAEGIKSVAVNFKFYVFASFV